jgi:pumilio RNA-binding family
VKSAVLKNLLSNTLEIVQDPFGNYVVQHVLFEWGVQYCSEVISAITTNIISLSMQKFSSNVVEKSLDICPKVSLLCNHLGVSEENV